MNLVSRANKLSLIGLLASVLALIFSATASAHVTVKPAEVVTAGFQTFTIGVPNEKNIPTTGIKLTIPDGLKHVSPTQKAGWEIQIEKQGEGESAVVKSITWTGAVNAGFRDEFTFSAQVPEKPTDLQWKAYQTYADGTVVSWDKSGDSGHDDEDSNSGPFSVTKVVPVASQENAQQRVESVAADAKKTADRSLYMGVAGILVGLVALAAATRKK